MPKLVVQSALLACTMGSAPSAFSPAPREVFGDTQPVGTIDDILPTANIPPFGMCLSPTNQQVQAATAAAMGVLTPQPCRPVISGAWSPGSTTVEIDDRPALHDGCTCTCQWAGTIDVTSAGQQDIDVD